MPSTPRRLRLLVCSDLRVQSIPDLIAWVGQLEVQPDLIVYAGDDVGRFRPDVQVNYWSDLAAAATYGLVAVRGNDDDPETTPAITGHRVVDLARSSWTIGDFVFHGAEGSETTPSRPGIGYLLRRPATIRNELEYRLRAARGKTHVLVAHSPPYGVLDDALRFTLGGGLRRIGSKAIRSITKETKRLRLVCCGHCHLQGGQHAKLGNSLVVNAASHDSVGSPARVAIVALTHEGVQGVEWHELKLALGFEGLPGFGPFKARIFREAGIPHTQALAAATPHEVARVLGWSPRAAVPILAAATAVTQEVPIVHAPLGVPPGPRILIDIETDLQQGAVWIVGLLDQATGEFRQLVARRDGDEHRLLKDLHADLTRRNRPVIAWSGSRFDERVLCQAYGRHRLVPPKRLIEAEDLMAAAERSVALPVRNWKLGTVALWCGFTFRRPELDGFMIGGMCTTHRRRGKPPPPEVLEYNEDDVMALHAVLCRLESLAAAGLTSPPEWHCLSGPKNRRKVRRQRLWPLARPKRRLFISIQSVVEA